MVEQAEQGGNVLNSWVPLLVSIAIIAVAVIAGAILHLALFFVLGRIANRSESIYIKPMVRLWRRPMLAIMVLFFIGLTYPLLQLSAGVVEVIKHLVVLALIVSMAWFGARTIGVFREILLGRLRESEPSDVEARRVETQVRILERIVVVIIWIIGVSSAIMTFPKIQQVGVSILASAGIAGLVVGLAAQRSLENLLAGIQIAFTQPLKIGDVVIVEGEYGTVEEVTLTYVVIRIWDLRRLVVPIKYFLDKPFENWTRISADLLGTVFIQTNYTVPVEQVRAELKRLVEGSEWWDGKAADIQVTDVQHERVQLRALVSAANSSDLWNLRCYVREKLVEFLLNSYPGAVPVTRVELISPSESGSESRTRS